jgi:hypothetical protein
MKFEQEHLDSKTPFSKLPSKATLSDANWVLVFGSVKQFKERDFSKTLSKRYPQAQIIGCTTTGEITPNGVYDDSVHITAMSWEESSLRVISRPVTSME